MFRTASILPTAHRNRAAIVAGAIGIVWALAAASGAEEAQPLLSIESFELDNGMTFLLVDRPQSPIVAAGWVAHVGSADDPDGSTGLSHMLEHMMFKGTRTIGTSRLSRDLKLIEQEDRLWSQIAELERTAKAKDQERIDRLREDLQNTIDAGRAIRHSGELDLLYAGAGATGLNAVTMLDLTAYYVSLPAEKMELWFWLESDRLLEPVFREFHVEKNVALEERRLRVESTPTGKLEEQLSAGFWGNDPYGRPAIGDPTDLARLGRPEARQHFERYYGASNLTAVLVGPVGDLAVREMAQRYFGRLASGPVPETAPPARSAGLAEPLAASCDCRPQARVLYPATSIAHPDSAALEVLVGLLNGRTGRLHRALVLDEEIAFSAFAELTTMQRTGLLALTAEGKGDTRPPELLASLDRQIARLRVEAVGERELEKVRNRLRAEALRRIRRPSQLMFRLLIHAGLGNPNQLNQWTAAISSVTADDVRRVAEAYLVLERRAVGLFDRNPSEPTTAATGGDA